MDISVVIHQNDLLILIETQHLRQNLVFFHHSGDSEDRIVDAVGNRRNRIAKRDPACLVRNADHSRHIRYRCLELCRIFIAGIGLHRLQYLVIGIVCLRGLTVGTLFLCILRICTVRGIRAFSGQRFQRRIRFLCSFLSGVLIWGNLSDGLPAWTYSLTYNGSYMLPETIMTTVAAVLIYKAAPQLFSAQND